jgi:hypothetical protein
MLEYFDSNDSAMLKCITFTESSPSMNNFQKVFVTLTQVCMTVLTIDLVLIDIQSVGKRSNHLIDTVNAKKR